MTMVLSLLKLDPNDFCAGFCGVVRRVFRFLISTERELKSGRIRLRDRQTLILTGVIQEDDRQFATKWPLLGDFL